MCPVFDSPLRQAQHKISSLKIVNEAVTSAHSPSIFRANVSLRPLRRWTVERRSLQPGNSRSTRQAEWRKSWAIELEDSAARRVTFCSILIEQNAD